MQCAFRPESNPNVTVLTSREYEELMKQVEHPRVRSLTSIYADYDLRPPSGGRDPVIYPYEWFILVHHGDRVIGAAWLYWSEHDQRFWMQKVAIDLADEVDAIWSKLLATGLEIVRDRVRSLNEGRTVAVEVTRYMFEFGLERQLVYLFFERTPKGVFWTRRITPEDATTSNVARPAFGKRKRPKRS